MLAKVFWGKWSTHPIQIDEANGLIPSILIQTRVPTSIFIGIMTGHSFPIYYISVLICIKQIQN